jgi:hypothetical protein
MRRVSAGSVQLFKIPPRGFGQQVDRALVLTRPLQPALQNSSRSAVVRKTLPQGFAHYGTIGGRCLWVGAQRERAAIKLVHWRVPV